MTDAVIRAARPADLPACAAIINAYIDATDWLPRARPAEEKASIVASVREHVWPMIASGRVRPIVNSTHRLADAAAAHRELEASGHVGKILLQP